MSACRTRWRVEAARDDRLLDGDRTQLALHLAQCTSCAREWRELETLADAMRALPAPQPDPLTLRRRRRALLSALEAAVSCSREQDTGARAQHDVARVGRLRTTAAAICLAAAFAVGVLAMDALRKPMPSTSRAAGPAVTAAEPPLSLASNHEAACSTAPVPPQDTAPPLATHAAAPPALRSGARRHAKPPQRPATASNTADAQFEQAVTELRAGEPLEAARLFAQFGALQPNDSRVEDAAFLRIVALSRVPLPALARAAAHAYLARFPHGLRAREVELLLTP